MQQAEDFLAECDALDALIGPLREACYETPTAFKGWTINNILRHLHLWNLGASLSVEDPDAFLALAGSMKSYLVAGTLTNFERNYLNSLSGLALRSEWQRAYRGLAETFSGIDPGRRVQWVGPSMSARSSVTARLMETWAHGQAIYDELGVVRKNTDRIKNIVTLGINTYEWSFRIRDVEPPKPRPFVRLIAPSGAEWSFGEDDIEERIQGPAEAFCQVVTQTRNIADVDLLVCGRNATAWMATAQCFAGGPEEPPRPGSRGTRRQTNRLAWKTPTDV